MTNTKHIPNLHLWEQNLITCLVIKYTFNTHSALTCK